MRWLDVEERDDVGVLDSVRIKQSKPVEDGEAASFEAVCDLASPGPMLIDDYAEGEGSVVATLPDGRRIICLCGIETAPEEASRTIEANARLICEARHMVLRLLRDRERCLQREEDLLAQIASLESRTEPRGPSDAPSPGGASPRSVAPR